MRIIIILNLAAVRTNRVNTNKVLLKTLASVMASCYEPSNLHHLMRMSGIVLCFTCIISLNFHISQSFKYYPPFKGKENFRDSASLAQGHTAE